MRLRTQAGSGCGSMRGKRIFRKLRFDGAMRSKVTFRGESHVFRRGKASWSVKVSGEAEFVHRVPLIQDEKALKDSA